jgi:hypothetical protein
LRFEKSRSPAQKKLFGGKTWAGAPTYLAHILEVLGHLWSQNDVIMSLLRLTATSNCFPHPY